jgi:hypothetical protein
VGWTYLVTSPSDTSQIVSGSECSIGSPDFQTVGESKILVHAYIFVLGIVGGTKSDASERSVDMPLWYMVELEKFHEQWKMDAENVEEWEGASSFFIVDKATLLP